MPAVRTGETPRTPEGIPVQGTKGKEEKAVLFISVEVVCVGLWFVQVLVDKPRSNGRCGQ